MQRQRPWGFPALVTALSPLANLVRPEGIACLRSLACADVNARAVCESDNAKEAARVGRRATRRPLGRGTGGSAAAEVLQGVSDPVHFMRTISTWARECAVRILFIYKVQAANKSQTLQLMRWEVNALTLKSSTAVRSPRIARRSQPFRDGDTPTPQWVNDSRIPKKRDCEWEVTGVTQCTLSEIRKCPSTCKDRPQWSPCCLLSNPLLLF